MTERKRIILAVGDVGAWAYFASIYPKLKERYDLVIRADPAGAAINDLRKAGIPHIPSDGIELLNSTALCGVSAILCGTAGKAFDLWQNATIAASAARVPVVWFGDFYASGCETRMADVSPDFMATFDDRTRERFLVMCPIFNSNHVRVLGNPSFDAIATMDLGAMRKKTRDLLGLSYWEIFVLYNASSMAQFDLEGESLNNLLPWVTSYGVRFAFRFHPADVKNKPEEVQRLNNRMKEEVGRRIVDTGDLKGLELAASADLLVTDYSTEGVRSTLAGIPTVFLMLGSSNEYLKRAKGSTFPHFSILEVDTLGDAPALVASTAAEVEPTLNVALSQGGRESMGRALKNPRYAPLCDGKAGERVLQFIKEIVGE